jgi:hypothetical protein
MNKILIEEILEKWEFSHNEIKYVLYPSPKPKKLVISFTTMMDTKNDFYSRISWFLNDLENNSDTTYLFLNDKENLYYASSSKLPLYRDVINKAVRESGLAKKNIFLLGNSMGGAGALYHAILSGFGGVILSNPQFDLESASMHSSNSWYQGMIGSDFKNLKEMAQSRRHLPRLYIEYSSYLPDFKAALNLLNFWGERGGMAIGYNNQTLDHISSRPNIKDITCIIKFMESFSGD